MVGSGEIEITVEKLSQGYSPVIVVLRLNLQHTGRWKVCEEYSSFNL